MSDERDDKKDQVDPEVEKPAAEASTEQEGTEAAEPEATEPEASEKESKPKRRRGATETSTKKPKKREITLPTNSDGMVAVRASARFVRVAPRKARLVIDHIRGKSVSDARTILRHSPRGAATDILKLLESAIANAENNFELDADDLRIHRATVDEGPTIKRFRPRALGRATPIHKRTSHMAIILTTTASEPSAAKAGRS